MDIYTRNNALDVNFPGGERHLSDGGSSWAFAVCALFFVSFLAYTGLSFRPHNGEKIFHYIFIVTLLVGTITYFAMGSDLGFSVIATHLRTSKALTYQIFFAKYIFWSVAFPAIIFALGLVSGVSFATIFFNIFLAWIWILSYLVGAYTASKYKWGFFTFGTLAYLLLAFQTLWTSRSSAKHLDMGRDHTGIAAFVNFFWFLYPIAWAVSDGGNVIGVTGSFIFFGILDLFLVLGVAFAFLFFSKKWDHSRLNLNFTQNGRVGSHHHTGGLHHNEKGLHGTNGVGAVNGHHNGVTNGHHVNPVTTGHHNTNPVTTGHHGHHDSNPITGHNSNPVTGGHNSNPLTGGHNSNPVTGGHHSNPVTGTHNSNPITGGHHSNPVTGGHHSNPVTGDYNNSNPLTGNHHSNPVTGGHHSNPVTGGHDNNLNPLSGGNHGSHVPGTGHHDSTLLPTGGHHNGPLDTHGAVPGNTGGHFGRKPI